MGAGYHGGFGKTKGNNKYFSGDAYYMNDKDNFSIFIKKRKDVDINGYFDIIAHGTNISIIIENKGVKREVNWRVAAKIIRSNKDYKNQNLRLLSCNTGQLDNGFAQNLANKLNRNVLAPTRALWTDKYGRHFVAGMDSNGNVNDTDKGTFKLFKPQRRI